MSGRRCRTGRDARATGAILSIGLLLACATRGVAAQEPERLADGVALTLGARRLELRACRDDVVRVIDAPPGAFFKRQSLMTVAGACQPTTFEVKPRPHLSKDIMDSGKPAAELVKLNTTSEYAPGLEDTLILTMKGIAAGMQNTG